MKDAKILIDALEKIKNSKFDYYEIYDIAAKSLASYKDCEPEGCFVKTDININPLKEGRYIVTNGRGWFDVNWDEHYGFHEEFTDCSGLTHYLRPTKNNI